MFRIASITKTFTAVAVMQLWQEGLVDLDAPAGDYLRTFRLIPAKPSFQPTVRHLLTHTAGLGYWRRLSDLLQPGVGSGDRARRSGASPLAEYYRRGLPVEIEPGTKWVYSNRGFAALGQIVEGVSGQPLDRYLRERIFAPLEMQNTDLVRSERVSARLATGYVLRSRGLRPVADREIPTPGGARRTRPWPTWPGTSSPCSTCTRAGKARCSDRRRWRRCFNPTSNSTRASWKWGSPSSPGRRAPTRPCGRPASCPAFTPRLLVVSTQDSRVSRGDVRGTE